MSGSHDEVRGRELAMTWELDLDYLTIARFSALVSERGLEHSSYTSWATEKMTLEGLLDRALSSLRDSSAPQVRRTDRVHGVLPRGGRRVARAAR